MKNSNKSHIKQNLKKTRNKRSLTKVIDRVSSNKIAFKPSNANSKLRHVKIIDETKHLSRKAGEFDKFVRDLLDAKKPADHRGVNVKNHKLLIFNHDKGFSSKEINDFNI